MAIVCLPEEMGECVAISRHSPSVGREDFAGCSPPLPAGPYEVRCDSGAWDVVLEPGEERELTP